MKPFGSTHQKISVSTNSNPSGPIIIPKMRTRIYIKNGYIYFQLFIIHK